MLFFSSVSPFLFTSVFLPTLTTDTFTLVGPAPNGLTEKLSDPGNGSRKLHVELRNQVCMLSMLSFLCRQLLFSALSHHFLPHEERDIDCNCRNYWVTVLFYLIEWSALLRLWWMGTVSQFYTILILLATISLWRPLQVWSDLSSQNQWFSCFVTCVKLWVPNCLRPTKQQLLPVYFRLANLMGATCKGSKF